MRDQRRRALKAAIQSALATLPAEERNLLRLHVLRGLTVEQIGASVGVHGSTVSRRIARSRATVLKHTQRELARLGVAKAEAESLMRDVTGQLDLSLHRVLGDEGGPSDDET